MSEAWLWLGAIALIFISFWALAADYSNKQQRSIEQYEKDVKEQNLTASLMRTGLLEMEKLTKPQLESSIEFLQDEKQWQTKQKKQGDDDREDEETGLPGKGI